MIELKKASFEDACLITTTRRSVWEQTYRGIYPDEMIDCYDYDHHLQRDESRILSPQHHHYLFMDDKDCVGYFAFGPANYGPYKDFSLCLNSLYICDGYKGHGLGKKAFSVMREYAASRGISKFFCGCNVHNEKAQAFYRHMGGVEGLLSTGHENRSEDIIHFEFYLGD